MVQLYYKKKQEVAYMQITDIRIKKVETGNRLKAIASVTIDDCETHYLLYLHNLIIAYKSFAKV